MLLPHSVPVGLGHSCLTQWRNGTAYPGPVSLGPSARRMDRVPQWHCLPGGGRGRQPERPRDADRWPSAAGIPGPWRGRQLGMTGAGRPRPLARLRLATDSDLATSAPRPWPSGSLPATAHWRRLDDHLSTEGLLDSRLQDSDVAPAMHPPADRRCWVNRGLGHGSGAGPARRCRRAARIWPPSAAESARAGESSNKPKPFQRSSLPPSHPFLPRAPVRSLLSPPPRALTLIFSQSSRHSQPFPPLPAAFLCPAPSSTSLSMALSNTSMTPARGRVDKLIRQRTGCYATNPRLQITSHAHGSARSRQP